MGVPDGTSNTIMVGEIVRHGLSVTGATEFLLGRTITNARDRRLIAAALINGLGLTAEQSIQMLIPVVQKIRDAATRTSLHLEISEAGVLQFLKGETVTSPNDRFVLAAVARLSTHRKGTWILDPSYRR